MQARNIVCFFDSVEPNSFLTIPLIDFSPALFEEEVLQNLVKNLKEKMITQVTLSAWPSNFFLNNNDENIQALFRSLQNGGVTHVCLSLEYQFSSEDIKKLSFDSDMVISITRKRNAVELEKTFSQTNFKPFDLVPISGQHFLNGIIKSIPLPGRPVKNIIIKPEKSESECLESQSSLPIQRKI